MSTPSMRVRRPCVLFVPWQNGLMQVKSPWALCFKIHCSGSPIWPWRCPHGMLSLHLTNCSQVNLILPADFRKIPQVFSKQPAWHPCRSFTIQNPLLPSWRLSVPRLCEALGAAHNLQMGRVEYWIFQPYNCVLPHLGERWPDTQEGGFLQP